MSIKNSLTPAGIEPATFRIVAQHLNHCATAVPNRSGYLTQFQKGTSRDASKHGRNTGTAVFMRKGSTLKVMEEFNIQGKPTSFYKYCPGTFGYTLLYKPIGSFPKTFLNRPVCLLQTLCTYI